MRSADGSSHTQASPSSECCANSRPTGALFSAEVCLTRDIKGILLHSLTQQLALEQNAVDEEVAALLVRRDQGRCCVSPRHCAELTDPIPDYILSPSFGSLLQLGNEAREARLLQAFVAPRHVPYLRSVMSPSKANTSNAWLLAPGLGLAIRQSQLKMRVLTRSPEYEKEPLMIETVDTIQVRESSQEVPCSIHTHQFIVCWYRI